MLSTPPRIASSSGGLHQILMSNLLGRMVSLLCSVLRRCVFLKGDVLSEQGAISNEMFFLEEGEVSAKIKPRSTFGRDDSDIWARSSVDNTRKSRCRKSAVAPMDLLQNMELRITTVGSTLGADSFLFGLQQSTTLTAEVRTICLSLRREDFTTVMTNFTADAHTVRRNMIELVRKDDPRR